MKFKSLFSIFRVNPIDKKILNFIIFLDTLTMGMSAIYPLFIGKIISLTLVKDVNNFRNLILYSVFFLLILLIWLFLGYISTVIENKYSQISLSNLRKRMLKSLFLMPTSKKEEYGTGYFQERIINETKIIKPCFYKIWAQIISQSINATVVLAIMIYINPMLTLVSFIVLPLSSYVAKKASKKINVLAKENREIEAKLGDYYQESIKTEKSIAVFYRVKLMLDKIDAIVDQVIAKVVKLSKVKYISYSISGTLGYYINGLVVLIVGGYLVLSGKLELSLWISFYFYPQYLWGSIEDLFNHYYSLVEYNAVVERIEELLIFEKKEFYQDIYDSNLKKISLKNITFSYNENKILSNFSYDFYLDRLYLILAESGKGKTTLLNIMSRKIKDNDGLVFINDISLNNFPSERSSIKIGILYQNTDIFHETIRENLVGIYGFDEMKFDKVIKATRLYDWIRELPEGENTVLAESGCSISGGQAQRLGIARLLYQDSNVWLLDEPTASLDQINENQILEIIEENKKNKIIICASHRKIFRQIADEIIEL